MLYGHKIITELKGDKIVWLVFILLSLCSILAVFSSSQKLMYLSADASVTMILVKHLLILLAGFAIVYVLHHVDYMQFEAISPLLFIIAIPLLIVTMFFGQEINEARRWIRMPIIGISIQTSDIAKIALVLYLSKVLSDRQNVIKDFKAGFLTPLLLILLVCGLIIPSDLSTAMIIFVSCICLLYVARVRFSYLLLIVVSGIILLGALFGLGKVFPNQFRTETWESRIESFVSGESTSSDNLHAKIAIAKGGVFGQGIGKSVQRNRIAYPYADFIYAIICEEYGLIGGLVIVAAYFMLLFRVVILATKTKKVFASLAAIGIALMIVIQAFGNIAVSLHLVPPTGLTLPMVSLGGSSLLFTCVGFGILLSITHFVNLDRMKAHGTQYDLSDA